MITAAATPATTPRPRAAHPGTVRRASERAGPGAAPFLVLGDGIVAFGAIALAYFLRFELFYIPVVDLPPPPFSRYIFYFALGAVLYPVIAGNSGLYDLAPGAAGRSRADQVIRAGFVWFFVFLGLSLFLDFKPPISRVFALCAFASMVAAQAGWRMLFARLCALSVVGRRAAERVLVVGLGPAAAAMAERFRSRGTGVYEFIGYVSGRDEGGHRRAGEGILGAVEDFDSLCASHQPDKVFVADGGLTQAEVMQVARVCERRFIGFFLAASSFEIFTSCLQLRRVAGVPVMGVAELPANRASNRLAKRVLDIAGAAVGLLLSAPVVAVLAVLIKRESRGPVFYRQIRVGQNGAHFTILKMRSMRSDAEAGSGARWCVEDDPRRTRIGEFMRRTNLDELPQFWNVLVGDMSLVGPRPERPELIPRFLNQIPYYQSRHSVKPGMTGWAQVNGLRGNTDLGERIRFDLHYIENWSLWWDISIAVQTFFKVRNAY